MNRSSPPVLAHRAGMTLVELLAVIAIIGLLLGAGASVFRGPRQEISVKGGVDFCAALVEQASTLAKTRRTSARLVFNVDPESPGYARQAAIYTKDENQLWNLRAGPHLFPRQVYLDQKWSDGFSTASFNLLSADPQPGTTGDDTIVYEFDRNGHFAPLAGVDEPRLVIVAGFVPETAPRELTVNPAQVNTRSGFLFRRNGFVTRFDSPDQIPEPANSTP